MSGRPAPAPHTIRRFAKFAAVVALAVLGGVAVAQPTAQPGAKDEEEAAKTGSPKETTKEAPKQPTNLDDIAKKAGNVDPNNPLDADAPGRKPHGKFALDVKRLIFNQVKDGPPVAAATENRDEYDAWCEVVLWAKKFTTTELEQHAARDLTPIDLHLTKAQRTLFRYELLRFDGKLVCIRRLEAPQFFKDLAKDNPDFKLTELYEARIVPLDESPLTPVSIVFLDLPEAFAEVAKKPFKEWLNCDAWVTAAGFYFKTMSVPGADGAQVISVPVLVGKSITVNKNVTANGAPSIVPNPDGTTNDPTALDRNVRVFKFVKDETQMTRFDSAWAEIAAENRVIIHASRFTPEQLEEHAIPDVKFADLFEEVRRDYKFKNVKMEGRLIRVRRMQVNNELKAAGVEQAFEGWLIPANEPRGNPVCIVFTELPEGVEPADRVNKWVTFAGFFFKKMRYKSGEPDPKRPGEYLDKYAPMLIGKGPIGRDERDPDRPTSLTWNTFLLAAIFCGVLLIGAAGLLTWYYRSGDRRAKEAMNTVRNHNPFDAVTGQGAPTTSPPA
jgi:hypothetical protein